MEPIDAVEARVLGALIEKEKTTPENYPQSLNALVNACNQKSNRYPVVDFDDDTVSDAIDRLRQQRFAAVIVGNGRVHKYAQRISETLNLGRREMAILGVLLLRGPQTLGEIKDRSERIFAFADLEETERVLEKLAEYPSGPLVGRMPRQPGQKEQRFAQLLTGEPVQGENDFLESDAPGAPSTASNRITQLESQVADLKSELTELRERLEKLENEFR